MASSNVILPTVKSKGEKERSIAVAKDVLEQLKLGKFIAAHVYVDPKYSQNVEAGWNGPACTLDVQKALKQNKIVKCHVCAMGSVFMSYANLYNSVTTDDIHTSNGVSTSSMYDTLKDTFTLKECILIEWAYEKGMSDILSFNLKSSDAEGYIIAWNTDYYHSESLDEAINSDSAIVITCEELNKAKKFGTKYRGSRNRLEAIMKKIIRDKGVFGFK